MVTSLFNYITKAAIGSPWYMLLSTYLLPALDPSKASWRQEVLFLHIPSILVARFRTLTQVPGRLMYMLKLCQDRCELINHWCFYIHFSFWKQKTDPRGGEKLSFRVTLFWIQMPTSVLSHPGYVTWYLFSLVYLFSSFKFSMFIIVY